jgi:hypothetical protein
MWLLAGRLEWRLEPRRLVLQRRCAERLRVLGEAHALELHEAVDSEGGRSYRLQAPRPDGRTFRLDYSDTDPSALRGLGAWLAARAHVPFGDRVPTHAQRQRQRRQVLAELHRQLQDAGPLGRWAARWIEREWPGDGA